MMSAQINLVNCHQTTISNCRIEAGEGDNCINMENSGTITIHGNIMVNQPIKIGSGVKIGG